MDDVDARCRQLLVLIESAQREGSSEAEIEALVEEAVRDDAIDAPERDAA